MRGRGALVAGALVGVLALAAAGCGGGDDNGGGGGGASATTAAPATTAAAAGGGEDELTLTAEGTRWDTTAFDLKSGSSYTLEVTNRDGIEHNFTFAAGKANQDIEANEDAKVTFTAPAAGSYRFFCKYHRAVMKGIITVT
jgi:plastocyanin